MTPYGLQWLRQASDADGFGVPTALAITAASEARLARVDQLSGAATGAGARATAADMHVEGQFTVPAPIDVGSSTVTVKSVLEQQCGAGELVHGLPLTPAPMPWNNSVRAGFEDRRTPNFTVIDIRSRGNAAYAFRLKISAATVDAPDSCPVVPLTTTVEVHDALVPPAHRHDREPVGSPRRRHQEPQHAVASATANSEGADDATLI